MTKRFIALILCLVLAAGLLTGCGGGIDDYDEPGGAEATAAPADDADAEATPDPDAGPTPEPTPEPIGSAAYPADTVVGSYNGLDIRWRDYYYWLSYYVEYTGYLAAMGALTFTDWDGSDISSEYTNADVVRLSAQDSLGQSYAVEYMAQEMGLALDSDDQARIQSVFEQSADSYGDGDGTCSDEEAASFESYLAEQFVDRTFFDHMSEVGILSDKVFAARYGEEGADLSDADAMAYAQEQGLLYCKHILLMTIDSSTGEALDEAALAEKKQTADDLYAQLAAVQDDQDALTELFDQLMNEYSEDTGLAMYPDGYLFTPGSMVAVFEDTTASLADYGLSEPVQSDYGYHIILRLPISPDQAVMSSTGESATVRSSAAEARFYQDLADTTAQADIQWKDGFDTIDIAEIFGATL